jgi:hypothetical protein
VLPGVTAATAEDGTAAGSASDPEGAKVRILDEHESRSLAYTEWIDSHRLEHREERWAGDMERQLMEEFSAYQEESGDLPVSLDEVDCRTTLCKLIFRYGDPRLVGPFQQALISRSVLDPDIERCRLRSEGDEIGEDGQTVQTLYVRCL